MIEYLRRYLADPEVISNVDFTETPVQNLTIENSLTQYLRRYLADPVQIN